MATSSPEGASCNVSDLLGSGSELPADMALGNSVENSINSPWMMQSLMCGGTVGSGLPCTGAVLLVVLVKAGRLVVNICSEAAESILSA